MAVEIITRDDLYRFRSELLEEISRMLDQKVKPPQKWLRSAQVREMLGISSGTLVNLRVSGCLPYSQLDGIFFYPQEEIQKILEKNSTPGRK